MNKTILLMGLLFCIPLVSSLNTDDILWTPLPLTNAWQLVNDVEGGEGFQQAWDYDWNLQDPNIIYAVVDTMKVWRSLDAGTTWRRVAKDVAVVGGNSIASDPRNASNVFYIASNMYTTESSTNKGALEGLYKSTDFGDNFTQIGGNHNVTRFKHGKQILFDNTSTFSNGITQTIYFGFREGLYKSTDGGDNITLLNNSIGEIYDLEWVDEGTYMFVSTNASFYGYNITSGIYTAIGTGLPGVSYDAAVDRTNVSVSYVASTNGVYKSINRGVNYATNSTGLSGSVSYRHIVISPLNNSRLIVSPMNLGGNRPYYSTNAGASWSAATTIQTTQFLYPNYYYAEPIIWSPINQNVAITLRDTEFAKTTDAGVTWNFSGSGYHGANINDIVFINSTSSIWCTIDYGIWRSDDNLQSFYSLNQTGSGSSRTCGGIDYNGSRIIGTYGDWGNQDVIASDNNGASWSTILPTSYGFDFLRFKPGNSSVIWADYNYTLNGGSTWTSTLNHKIMAIDPRDNTTIYSAYDYGTVNGIFKSVDNGVSWTLVGTNNVSMTSITSMSIDPFNTTTHIIVSGSTIYQWYGSGAWVNRESSTDLPASSYENYQGVYFDSLVPGRVWVGLYGYRYHGRGLYLSQNYGTNWINVMNNIGTYNNVWRFFVNPYTTSTYMNGGTGLFELDAITESCMSKKGIWCDVDGCYYELTECSESSAFRTGSITCTTSGCV